MNALRPLVIAAAYLAAWEALTRLSPVTAAAFYLPTAAISVYVLMRFGIGYASLVIVAEMLHRLFFPDPDIGRVPIVAVFWFATTKAATYAVVVAVLRYLFRVSPSLRTSRDLALFFVIAGTAGPYMIALYTTTLFVAYGVYSPTLFAPTFHAIWLAYSTGIVTGYPLLIYFVEPLRLGFRVGRAALLERAPMLVQWRTAEVVVQYALLCSLLFYSLHAYFNASQVNAFYLVLPLAPLAWIGIRRGLFAAGFACFAVAVATTAYVNVAERHIYTEFVNRSSLVSNAELQWFILINSLITFALATLSSERADAERRLDYTEFALEQARELSLVMSAELTTSGLLHNASRQFRKVFAIPKKHMRSRSLLDLVHDEDRGAAETALSSVSAESSGVERRVRMKNANGEWLWIDLVLTGGRNAKGRVDWILAFLRDVTRQKVAEDALAQSAYYDHLTGLANRLHLEESLRESIAREKREGSTLAVLYLDLDKFKPINDAFGHAVGDKVLVEVGRRLKYNIRETDIAARLGGDEFVVVLQDIHHTSSSGIPVSIEAAAHMRASKILADLRTPFLLDSAQAELDASIGISIFPDDANDVASLLKYADAAMYRAKQVGRSEIKFYSEVKPHSVAETAQAPVLER